MAENITIRNNINIEATVKAVMEHVTVTKTDFL